MIEGSITLATGRLMMLPGHGIRSQKMLLTLSRDLHDVHWQQNIEMSYVMGRAGENKSSGVMMFAACIPSEL